MTGQRDIDPIACFLTACEMERREHRASGREHKVTNGRQINAEQGRFFYSFETPEELPYREHSSIQVIVNGAFYLGTVIECAHRSLTITVGQDLGTFVSMARIEGGQGDLLQALVLRLKSIQRGEGVSGFNRFLADRILALDRCESDNSDVPPPAPPDDLTLDQQEAFARCLSQSVTYVWGPPGTGKTALLAAIAWQLHSENKRVLIVSHTNHAVDGVVENLCSRIAERKRTSIPDGSIIRLGLIVRESLIKQFGHHVHLDSVVNRNHDKVSQRLESLHRELSDVRNKLFGVTKKISLLDSYTHLHGELRKLKSRASQDDRGLVQVVRKVFQAGGENSIESVEEQDALRESIALLESNLAQVSAELQGCERAQLEELSIELSSRQIEISEAIALLEKFVRDLRLSLLDRARVVATTATQAMLSRDLNNFDVVLIDEASMIPVPLTFILAGYARERVVIAGDFRQLPAISSCDSHIVQEWYARDIFFKSGVVDMIDSKRHHRAIAILTTQFRSNETLCGLINDRFYGGILRTSPRERKTLRLSDPLTWCSTSPIVLIDSSELAPRGALHHRSKANVTHALIARKIALALAHQGFTSSADGLGIIAPYRQQAALIRDLLAECQLSDITVGTIHRFQGSEREAIILDLTDSPPHTLGTFLGAHSLSEVGARLLTVALSRARSYIFVIAHLSHLRAQLERTHILSGVLDDLERMGCRAPLESLISQPIVPQHTVNFDATTGVMAFQSFDHEIFFPALVTDLIEARHEIVLSSPNVGKRVSVIIRELLREPIQRGVRVIGIIDGSRSLSPDEQSGIHILREVGVLIVRSISTPGAFVVVDSEIIWLGSVPPLDCLERGSGLMARSVSSRAAHLLLDVEQSAGTGGIQVAAVAN